MSNESCAGVTFGAENVLGSSQKTQRRPNYWRSSGTHIDYMTKMNLREKLAIPSLHRLTKRNEGRVSPLRTEKCQCANVQSLLLRRSHHQDNHWILTTRLCLYQVSWILLALLCFPFTKLRSYGRGSCSLGRHQLSKLVILVGSLPDITSLKLTYTLQCMIFPSYQAFRPQSATSSL